MKNKLLFYAILFVGIFTIAACKTDPKVDSNSDNTTVNPKKETTVSMRIRVEPEVLNPILTTLGPALEICNYLFLTIMEHDPFTLELSPILVKTRPVIEEIKEGERAGWTSYTYEILEEAVWEDGSPVTGHDYLFALKVIYNPHVGSGPYRDVFGLIKAVEVDPDNPKRYTVFTNEKYMKAEYATGYFIYPQYKYDPEKVMDQYSLNDLRNPDMAEQLKNDETLKSFGEVFNSPKFSRNKDFIEGCGPYKLEEWVDGERIVLVKKENWWGDKLIDKYPQLTAHPKRLVFKPIPDATTALTLMKNQELDVITKMPEAQFLEFGKTDIAKEFFDLKTPPLFLISFYAFNTKNPKLSDKRVRRALAHLMDIDEILESVKMGFAEPIIGPFHPLRSYYHKGLKPIKLDIEKAKKMLAEAGWKDSNNNGTVDKVIDGELIEMEIEVLITPNNKTSTSIALIYQNEAKKAGVKINIVEKDNAALTAQIRAREFDIFVRGKGGDIAGDDPKQYWHTSSDTPRGYNRFGFGNAETDQLINDIRTELDEEKRLAMFLKFQEIIYEEQPAIFLYTTLDKMAIHKRLKNVETTLRSPGYFANYWYEE